MTAERRRIMRRSRRQERGVADKIGGRTTPGSGAGWSVKNDARSKVYLVEAKRTDNTKQITLKHDDLRGVMRNAVLEGRVGALAFELNGYRYIVQQDDDWEP